MPAGFGSLMLLQQRAIRIKHECRCRTLIETLMTFCPSSGDRILALTMSPTSCISTPGALVPAASIETLIRHRCGGAKLADAIRTG